MTYGLLNAATVLKGDGQWTNSYEVDALSCGRIIRVVDICVPGTPEDPEQGAPGYKIVPFALVGEQKMGTRCSTEESENALVQAMDKASEYFVAGQFWRGDVVDWAGAEEGMFLEHADIEVIAGGASVPESVTLAVLKAYENHPEIDPIVHMGIGAATSFVDNLFTQEARDANMTIVVSPGYPADGIAVTGPIVVHLGSIETVESVNWNTNKRYLSGTRLASVEFDPCLAVRVA